jgi:hypothetical protein
LNEDDGISSGKIDFEGETSTRTSSTSTAFLFLRALDFFAEVRSLALRVLGVGEPSVFFCVAGVAYVDSVWGSGVWKAVSCVAIGVSSLPSVAVDSTGESLPTTTFGLDRRRIASFPPAADV